MGSRLIALIVLGFACIVAAAGGAYLAVRQAEPASAQAGITPSTDVGRPSAALPASQPAPATSPGIVNTPPPSADVELPPPSTTPETRNRTSNNTVTPRTHSRAEAGVARKPASEEAPSAVPAPPSTEATNAKPGNQAAEPAGQAPVSSTPAVPDTPSKPLPDFVDLTVPAESVLGLQVQTPVSSETARVEDRVDARVTRDVRVGDRVAIPSGTQVIGSVVQVDRGGKVRERASLAVRFHTLILPDGTRTSLTTEAVHREGPSPAGKSAAKIGGAAVGGAILGAILGGGKGAAIGGSLGAAGGTAVTMAGQREPATLPAGTIVNVRLMSPVTVTLER